MTVRSRSTARSCSPSRLQRAAELQVGRGGEPVVGEPGGQLPRPLGIGEPGARQLEGQRDLAPGEPQPALPGDVPRGHGGGDAELGHPRPLVEQRARDAVGVPEQGQPPDVVVAARGVRGVEHRQQVRPLGTEPVLRLGEAPQWRHHVFGQHAREVERIDDAGEPAAAPGRPPPGSSGPSSRASRRAPSRRAPAPPARAGRARRGRAGRRRRGRSLR